MDSFAPAARGFDSLRGATYQRGVQKRLSTTVTLLLGPLLAAGCAPPPAQAFPRVTSGPGFPVRLSGGPAGDVEVATPPQRILPGNVAFVDFLWAIVEPERIVAIPRASDGYSSAVEGDAAWSERPRYEGFDVELVLALAPDLVLAHPWQTPETLADVRARGVPVVVLPLPETWRDVLATLELLGSVCGAEERVRTFCAELEARRERLSRAPHAARGWSALSYSNLGTGGSVAAGGTTADILFELAGLENAARELGLHGHADLDVEGLLALDPDVIVVGASVDGSPSPALAFLDGSPELRGLRALREGRVVTLPSALFSSASFELLTAAERLASELALGE
jgi:iron complex transport system substrate-binding protein